MSESMLKAFGILSLIGAIVALIGFCVPALLYTSSHFNTTYTSGFWFFGLIITFHTSPTEGRGYSVNFFFDEFSYIAGIMLLGTGILSLILRGKVKNWGMDPKKAGITLLILGIVSIISIGIWLRYRFYFYIPIGPGVIIGVIGAAIIIISAILALAAPQS